MNGEKIDGEAKLGHGDEIAIGESTIIFSTDDSPDAIRCFEMTHRIRGGYDKTSSELDARD